MRKGQAVVAFLLVMITLFTAGCGRTFFYDFSEEGSLTRGGESWTANFFPGGIAYFCEDGYYLDSSCLSSPFEFSGDFTYTVKFLLEADHDHVCNMLICLTDAIGMAHDNGLHFSFNSVGAPGSELTMISDLNMPSGMVKVHVNAVGTVPGLQRSGINVFRLIKRGDSIEASINGAFLAAFNLEWYGSDWFNPAIMGDLNGDQNPDYGFTLISVMMQYDGEVKPMDL